MDPASVTLAIGAASKAFSMLKRGFEIGRDIESMHGDIQKWMGASAQIAAIEKTTKNPSVYYTASDGRWQHRSDGHTGRAGAQADRSAAIRAKSLGVDDLRDQGRGKKYFVLKDSYESSNKQPLNSNKHFLQRYFLGPLFLLLSA
jgi:hypothetical protein